MIKVQHWILKYQNFVASPITNDRISIIEESTDKDFVYNCILRVYIKTNNLF